MGKQTIFKAIEVSSITQSHVLMGNASSYVFKYGTHVLELKM